MPIVTFDEDELELLKEYYDEAADRFTKESSHEQEHTEALNLHGKVRMMLSDQPSELSHKDIERIAIVVDAASGWHIVGTPTALSLEQQKVTEAIKTKVLQANKI